LTTKNVAAQHKFNKRGKLPLLLLKSRKINVEAEKKRRLAVFEDQLCKEDQQLEKNMAHPDLVSW